MLTEILKTRISRLTWPQFGGLVNALKLDITQFYQGDTPAERTLAFENQCIAAGDITCEDVEAALKLVLKVTNSDEADREILKANINEANQQLQTPLFQNGQNMVLRQQVKQQIDSIRAAKAIHACVQHQIWYKVPECLARARADLSQARERNAARKTLESIRNDLQNIQQHSAFLRATYQIQLDLLTTAMLTEINQLLRALRDAAGVDFRDYA